jgi:hypothetical protein
LAWQFNAKRFYDFGDMVRNEICPGSGLATEQESYSALRGIDNQTPGVSAKHDRHVAVLRDNDLIAETLNTTWVASDVDVC